MPRIPLAAAASTKALQLLKRHGYFVATDLGAALGADVASIENRTGPLLRQSARKEGKMHGHGLRERAGPAHV